MAGASTSLKVGLQWGSLVFRIRRLRKNIQADPRGRDYMDESLSVQPAATQDDFVQVYADKIPKTHGAPKQRAVEAAE